MRLNACLSFALFVVSTAGIAGGCSGADQTPLGGPYGGTANAPEPSYSENDTLGQTSSGGRGGVSGGSGGSPNVADASVPATSPSGSSSASAGSPPAPTASGSSSPGGSPAPDGGSSPRADGGSNTGSDSGSATGSGCTKFSCIYTTYFATPTGSCTTFNCHGLQMGSAKAAYQWLQTQPGGQGKQLGGSGSCLSWVSPTGNMPLPPGSATNAQAAADLMAWAAAGAQNN